MLGGPGPNPMWEEAAIKQDPSGYPSTGPLFVVFILLAIAGGTAVSIVTQNLLAGGITFAGLIALGVLVTMLVGHRRKRQYERYIEQVVAGGPKHE